MTTTTPTPTIELADIHRIAGDFLARTDINTQALDLTSRSIKLAVADSDWASLRALYTVLDNPHVTVYKYEPGQYAFRMILKVEGKYRGVNTYSQLAVNEPTELDLISVFMADNMLNDARLLDVLVDASREG